MQNTNPMYVQNCEKFIQEIIPAVIGNGDFSNYSHEGIIDFGGKIGNDVLYHGIYGLNHHDLGVVKNTNTMTRVALSQMVKPHTSKALCYFEYKSSQWNYEKQTALEKDELKHTILVKTPKVLAKGSRANIKDCGGFSRDGVEGILRVEYGKGEDPDLFLANLFQTIERSQQHAKETINQQVEQSGTGKKLSKLNFIAKLAHLVRRQRTTEQAQEM